MAILGRFRICCYLAFFFIVISCKKENSEIGSGIFFKNLKEDAVLWNTVSIELSASDPAGIDKIEVYAGADLLTTLRASPYVVSWNTRDRNDGNYILRAVSTNINGVQKSTTLSVSVRNILISLVVPADQLSSSNGVDRGFLSLSDRDGKTVVAVEYKNGDTVNIAGPEDFSDRFFTLSEVYTGSTTYLQVVSFQEVPRGKWTLTRDNRSSPVVGNMTINFTGSGVDEYYISTNGGHQFYNKGDSLTTLSLTKSPSKLFVREATKGVNHYKIINDLSTGPHSVSLSDVILALDKVNVTVPDPNVQSASMVVYGFPSLNQYSEYYRLGQFFYNDVDDFTMEYPSSEFPVFGSNSHYRDNTLIIDTFNPTALFDFAPIRAEVTFKQIEKFAAQVTTYGDFVMNAVGWAYSDLSSGSQLSWTLIGPNGRNQTVKLPELPTLISSAVPQVTLSNAEFLDDVEVVNYGIASDYDSYLKYVSEQGYNAPFQFGNKWKEQLFYESRSTGGRINSAEPKTLRELFGRKGRH